MKIGLRCMACLEEDGHPPLSSAAMPLNDDGYFYLRCPRGHESYTLIQEPKHELLFDVGMNAILDGYHREAVTSFSASLERFYEFCIKMLLLRSGASAEEVEHAWNPLAKQSERQLGAYVAIWVSHFKRPPSLLSNKNVEFRNNVVHRGCIPTEDEAIRYGEEVALRVQSSLKIMCESFGRSAVGDAFIKEFLARARAKYEQAPPKHSVGTLGLATTIKWEGLVATDAPVSLMSRLEELAKGREYRWPAWGG